MTREHWIVTAFSLMCRIRGRAQVMLALRNTTRTQLLTCTEVYIDQVTTTTVSFKQEVMLLPVSNDLLISSEL